MRARVRVDGQRECSLLGNLLGLLGLCLLSSLSGSLLFLDVLGDELLVLGSSLLGSLGTLNLGLLDDLLSSDAFLSDESLDSWGLVVGLVSLGDGTVVHVSTNIIGLLKVEVGLDVVSSLLGETVWLVGVGEAGNVLLSLLEDGEGDDGEIWSTDASTD